MFASLVNLPPIINLVGRIRDPYFNCIVLKKSGEFVDPDQLLQLVGQIALIPLKMGNYK